MLLVADKLPTVAGSVTPCTPFADSLAVKMCCVGISAKRVMPTGVQNCPDRHSQTTGSTGIPVSPIPGPFSASFSSHIIHAPCCVGPLLISGKILLFEMAVFEL